MSFNSTALPSSKKTHLEQHKQILKQLLREDPNKTCADCKTSKNPRWASWSLGCFVCIRCSGIHRSMGTHISKVKSVDLDAWTDDQVENMVRWGNQRANLYWEAKLPDGYVPDQLKIENFIRTKYDLKKWKDSQDIRSFNPTIVKKTAASPAITTQMPPAPVTRTTTSSSANSFSSINTLPPAPVQHTNSAPTPTPPPAQLQQNQPLQSAQSTGGSISSNGRPDLKKSILSLYSSPSSSSSFLNQQQPQQPQQQQFMQQSFQQARVQQTPLSYTPPPPQAQQQPIVNKLDDDLFKNVWS
ncbi:hypothetical protein Cantr_04587 [Candida viswanathii]|uniref:Arf-GAP domain-containing protein n=1 Tax=Candida viswanathii TaxID=5486 RepID=A0A367XN93_9ASCO|nr:hypothetical protein Cantr_04587 [Candida viswanathii]